MKTVKIIIFLFLSFVIAISCSSKDDIIYNYNNINMNSIAYFEIQSSYPEREIAFYKAVFGWNFVKEESLPIEYYRIETGGISGGLLQRPAAVPPLECGTNAFTCSVLVENFDETSEKILKAGGRIAMPKFAIWGRWQGYFIDTDNNTFGIFEMDNEAK
jgi:predicted enzyme related to lactoylglutathione lyase